MRTAFKLLPLVFAACLLLPAARLRAADDLKLRSTLDRVYLEWRGAVITRNMEAWKRYTTGYRQMVSRNLIVSQGQPYPEAIFDLPVAPPEILKLKLLEAEAVGPTAHLVYFGKVDLGLGVTGEKLPNNLLVLKFLNETGEWRFDSSKFINLNDSPDIRKACEEGHPDFLKDPPFNPPGVLPVIPKPCARPEKVAALRIEAVGYEVKARINGYDYPVVADNAEQQVIIGGLARGDNDLLLDIKPIPAAKNEDRILNVQAIMYTGDPKHPTVKVFDWTPRYHPAEPNVKLNMSLNNVTMKGI